MDDKDENLRTQLIEAILGYFEGRRTLPSVMELGVTAYKSEMSLTRFKLAEVVSQLNSIKNEIDNGKSYSYENLKEIFTTMLEKLISA